jgi:hypothetical protein
MRVPVPVAAGFARVKQQRATVRSCSARPVMSKTVMSPGARSKRCLAAQQVAEFEARAVSGAHWVSPICGPACGRRPPGGRAPAGLRAVRACRGVGADAVQVRAGLHGLQIEERAAARRGGDHDVALRDRRVAVGGGGDAAAAGEVVFERGVALAVGAHVENLAQRGHQAQREVELDARLHAGAEEAQPRAVGPCELLQAEPAGCAGAHGRDRVAVDDAQRPARGGVDQQDGRLVRLAAALPVGGPEAGGLEAEQALRLHVARLDAEHAARGERLAHDREHAALAVAVQHEGLAHGLQHVVGGEEGVDLVLVEQQEKGVGGRRRMVSSGNIIYFQTKNQRTTGQAGSAPRCTP